MLSGTCQLQCCCRWRPWLAKGNGCEAWIPKLQTDLDVGKGRGWEHGIQLAGTGELTSKSPHHPPLPRLSRGLLHSKILLWHFLDHLVSFIQKSPLHSGELRGPGIGWILHPLHCRTNRHYLSLLESDLHRLLRRHFSALHRGERLIWLTARVQLQVSPAAGLRVRFDGAAPPCLLLRRRSELMICHGRVGFTCLMWSFGYGSLVMVGKVTLFRRSLSCFDYRIIIIHTLCDQDHIFTLNF